MIFYSPFLKYILFSKECLECADCDSSHLRNPIVLFGWFLEHKIITATPVIFESNKKKGSDSSSKRGCLRDSAIAKSWPWDSQ